MLNQPRTVVFKEWLELQGQPSNGYIDDMTVRSEPPT
jgi:hypothetical protein